MTLERAFALIGALFFVWCAASVAIGGWLADAWDDRVKRDKPVKEVPPLTKHRRPY